MKIRSILAGVALLVATLGGVNIAPATVSAAASNCYPESWGNSAIMRCGSGTGQFRLIAGCNRAGWDWYVVYGPWRNSPGTSFASCGGDGGPGSGRVVSMGIQRR